MEEQACFLPSGQELVKILLDPPPALEILQAPGPGMAAPPSSHAPVETHPEANPQEDSAWAALAGAAIILNPLLEDLAATHLSRQRNGGPVEEKPKVRHPKLQGGADDDEPGSTVI